jgi:peptide/nickel transport system permease protein
MLGFIARRIAATIVVLLVASFFVYVLTAYSGDPLQDLRTSRDPDIQVRIDDLTRRLNLDVPPVLRYFLWLGGAAGCLIGRCDLGVSIARGEQPVLEALAGAIGSTLQLVTLATVLSIVIGVAVGMTTALRQYSGYDYTVTFFAFVFYSLPIFWVAVLLKEFGAIRFNQFLGNPFIPLPNLILLALLGGFVMTGIIGGGLQSRLRNFAIFAGGSAALMAWLNASQWLKEPSFGLIGVFLLVTMIAALMVFLSTGFANRQGLLVGAVTAIAVSAMWYPLQFLYFYVRNGWALVITVAALVAVGLLVGALMGGDNRREMMRLAGAIGGLATIVMVIDRMLQYFYTYTTLIPIKTGIISTIGATTPAIGRVDNMWIQMLDSYAHLVLPTIALMIISIAGYTRYARASLLEVMNQDYIRTARAKGLPERTVVMRHAFRNAMIPIATIVTIDFGGIIGGAIITERVFAWSGMGALFNQGLNAVDVNLVMGFFLVTGLLAVIFNIVADLLYSALDPRIRVG